MILRRRDGAHLPDDPSTAGSPAHSPPMPLRRFVPHLCLCLLVLTIWCGLTQRWSLEAWRTPLQLHGDPLEIYARVQAAAEDFSQPLRGFVAQPRLAAPLGADWSRYPVSDRVVFTGLGVLASAIGVFAAINLAMAATHVLNALAFYLCARFLRWRQEWAFAVALLFSFSSYNFRWSVTVSFSLTFVIPPLLLLCGWIARAAPPVSARSWTWLALALGLWFGGANPYLGFFAVQLAAGAVLLQFARRREFVRWRAGVMFIAVTGLSFLLHNAAYFLSTATAAPRLTLERNYAGAEIYALKLTDLLVPASDHPLVAFGEIGRGYFAQSALRTEFFVNYLGVFGILGLAVLAWAGVRGLLRIGGARVPDAFLGVMWTLLFSAVGGVNALLALAGFDAFRASNRNSVFILVWALFFLGAWCQRRWRPRSLWLRWALPAAIAAFGIMDSLPKLRAHRTLRHNAAEISSHREFVTALEARLGPDAMIFQLPATAFPEAGVVGRMPDYEHFLPYLLSDSLRFSYGALRGTEMSRGLRALGNLPATQLREELEAAGFHAIWIDRRGLPDGAAMLLAELRALGLEEISPSSLSEIAVFILQPADQPRPLDFEKPAFYEAWDGVTPPDRPRVAVLDGWYALEFDGSRPSRWARASATTQLQLPTGGPVELRFRANSLEPGELVISYAGEEVYRQPVNSETRELHTIELRLGAGQHRLEWRFTGRVTHPPAADHRELGFAISGLEVVPLNPAAP